MPPLANTAKRELLLPNIVPFHKSLLSSIINPTPRTGCSIPASMHHIMSSVLETTDTSPPFVIFLFSINVVVAIYPPSSNNGAKTIIAALNFPLKVYINAVLI